MATKIFRSAMNTLAVTSMSLGLSFAAIPSEAHASAWGCEVALCLATPGSPTTYAACVPPITKLWQALATGGDFPACAEGGIALTRYDNWPIVTVTQADGSKSYYWLAQDTSGQVTGAAISEWYMRDIARAEMAQGR